jgi:hypothetical protein
MFSEPVARVAEGELDMKKRKTPPVDIRKVIRAAAEAALEEPEPAVQPKKRRHSGRRAVLLGAGLVAAGRALGGGRGRDLLASVQDGLAGLGGPGRTPAAPELDADELVDEPLLDDDELVDEPMEEIDDVLADEPDAEGEVGGGRRKARRGRGS